MLPSIGGKFCDKLTNEYFYISGYPASKLDARGWERPSCVIANHRLACNPNARHFLAALVSWPTELAVTVPLNPSHSECGKSNISGHLFGEHCRRFFAQ